MREKFEVAWVDRMEEVPGLRTPLAGVVLTDVGRLAQKPQVTVTHERSGAMIAAFASAETAARFVIEWLAQFDFDWSLPAVELRAAQPDGFGRMLREARERYDGWEGAYGESQFRQEVHRR